MRSLYQPTIIFSKTTRDIHNYMNHDNFSRYFLDLAIDERPLDKEKLQRRLREDLYVSYSTMKDGQRATFIQTLISGVLNLFFYDDLERLKLGLLVVKTERCLEEAKEAPFAIISDELIWYVLDLTEVRLKNMDLSKKGHRDAKEMAKELRAMIKTPRPISND